MATLHTRVDNHPSGSVAWVTVDNRAKLNVIGGRLIRRLDKTIDRLGKNSEIRALVLKGQGTQAFIGGADIGEMADFTPDSARSFITDLHGLCRRLRDCPIPTLARIEGYCLGAGMEIATCCDLRAASTNSKFGMPEVRVGIPSVIEAALLPRLVGWGRTSELVLTGDIVDGPAAHAMGFVQRLVPSMDLDNAIDRWLDSILAAGPAAIRSQKALLRRWAQLDLESAIEVGMDFFADAYRTDEPHRRMRGFLNAKLKRG